MMMMVIILIYRTECGGSHGPPRLPEHAMVSIRTGTGISTGWVSFVWTLVSSRLLRNYSYEKTDRVPDLIELMNNRTAIDSENPLPICQSTYR